MNSYASVPGLQRICTILNGFILIAVFLPLLLLTGCVQQEEAREVRLDRKSPLKVKEEHARGEPIRIAVGAMITPSDGFAYYRSMLTYIGEKLEKPVKFVDRQRYAEINSMLKTGQLDAAFVCSGPYVDGHEEFGLELLAMPVAYGKAEYHSYIIVYKDSPARTFEDLRGKSFAFTDPKSNTGKLVPTYMLAKMGETPDSFFGRYMFTYAHDKSIKAVALKLVYGAAVDSLVWEYSSRMNPKFTSRTRVLLKSPPYGIPPFVVRPGLDPGLKAGLREIFLKVHEDKNGAEILGGMKIDRFVQGDDAAYDSVREMKAWVSGNKSDK
jgi:phosphonate transport system substrate-binding protein